MGPRHQPDLSLAALERRILYEDADLVAVDKPWGWPSTGRHLEDSDCLQYALIQRHGGMVWAVHQLDADTSGINLFVRRKDLVSTWQRRMRHPNGTKTYLALVHGCVDFEERTIDAPIGVLPELPGRQLGIVDSGKRAVTTVQVLGRGEGASLLRVRIETGRTHQIRIHLASLAHPVLGEEWYRTPASEAHHRQGLHAWRVEFQDAGAPGCIECPLPDDLVQLAYRVGLEPP